MKLTREIVNAIKAVSETDIRAYAAEKAGRIMRIKPDGSGDYWNASTPMEATLLTTLICGAILAGRHRVTENDLTPGEIIHACADTAEFAAMEFFAGVNCAYSVCYPVLDWFRERGAY